MKRGMYRVHGTDGRPDDVRIEDDGIEMPLAENLYRTRGYLPPIEDLPWREAFFAPKASSASTDAAKGQADKAAREVARQDFLGRFRKP